MSSDLFDRQASLGYLINYLARLYNRNLEQRLRRQGISIAQFAAQLVLYEEPDLTQSEICQRLLVEQPTIANTLKRMEHDGQITLRQDLHDRRCKRYRLTPDSHAVMAPMIEQGMYIRDQAFGDFEDDTREQLIGLLSRMIDNLERMERQG